MGAVTYDRAASPTWKKRRRSLGRERLINSIRFHLIERRRFTTSQHMTLEHAKKGNCAAEQKSWDNLVAFAHMGGAWLGSVDIAINKVFTSRVFDISTKELSKLSQSGEDF